MALHKPSIENLRLREEDRAKHQVSVGGHAVVLGFGEAGQAVSARLRESAFGSISALDLAAQEDSPRASALRKRAAEMGISLYSEPGDWLATADLVMSMVIGPQALPVARSVAPYLRPGTLYADLNTAPPEVMRSVADLLGAGGVVFADVAVLGSFQQYGYRVPMMAAGPGAESLATKLGPLAFDVTVIGDGPGDASAVKMLRSVFMKGLEALCVECFVAAEGRGLRDRVIQALGDLDQKPIASTIDVLLRTHGLHVRRRREEVAWVAESLRRDGLDLIMTEATLRLFDRTAAFVEPPSELPTAGEALETLCQVVRAQ